MKPLRKPAAEESDDQDDAPRRGPRRLDRRKPRADLPPRWPSRRFVVWSIVATVVLVVGLVVAKHADEIVRQVLEARINRRLQGYSVSIAAADLRPLKLGLAIQDAVVRQHAHPQPPVMVLPSLEVGVQWRELLRFHLVADAVFDRPRVHANLPQLREEDQDEIAIEDRGWQDAFQSIYPLKFNHVEVRDGEIVYVDRDPDRPLELSHWHLVAENIRNARSAEGVYPSPVRTEAVLFGSGRGVLEGHADFLSKPYPGVHAAYRLDDVPLERLGMLSSRANLELEGGVLDSRGKVEYSPLNREAQVAELTIDGLHVDYIHTAATAEAEKARAAAAARVAQDPQPDLRVRVDDVRLTNSVFGLVNRAAADPYRVFIDHGELVVTGLSSGLRERPAKATLTGRFMGSGATRAQATFRQHNAGPSFDLDVAIEDASLPAMNDLLRSYGKLDVVDGSFSVYSEVEVDRGRIAGYVKPLIRDVEVYSSKQDKKKPLLKRLYEKIAGGLSHLLENRPRDEVATVVDLSGSLDDPNTSTWEVVARLVGNAFVKAILPGFDREVEAAQRGRGKRRDGREGSREDRASR